MGHTSSHCDSDEDRRANLCLATNDDSSMEETEYKSSNEVDPYALYKYSKEQLVSKALKNNLSRYKALKKLFMG